MENIPSKVEKALLLNDQIKRIGEAVQRILAQFIYLGRSYNFPVALEGCA